MATLSTPKQSLRWSGGTAVTWYKSWLSENSQFTSCNYEFYEDVNAFYKLVSRNYGTSDMAFSPATTAGKNPRGNTVMQTESSHYCKYIIVVIRGSST